MSSDTYVKPRYRGILYAAQLPDFKPMSVQKEEAEKILRNGIFLNNNKWFYWLDVENDKKAAGDCYIVLASALQFTDLYGNWKKKLYQVTEQNGTRVVEVEKLEEKLRWLEVKGQFSTVNLQLGFTYRVSFLVKVFKPHDDNMSLPSNGDGVLPVELNLITPRRNQTNLRAELKKDQINDVEWTELTAGTFVHNQYTLGMMYFSMKNTDATWKNGISVLGVCIKPDGTTAKTKAIEILRRWNPPTL